MRYLRLAVAVAIIFVISWLPMNDAGAAPTGPTTITCADASGTQRTSNVSWDNSNAFFNGKGSISRLFCEGGYSGNGFTTFVSTTQSNPKLDFYNGVIPTPAPAPTPEPSPSPSPTVSPTPTPEPSGSTQPSPEPQPSQSSPAPQPSPTSSDTPTASSSPEPTSSPEPNPTPTPTSTPQTPSPTPVSQNNVVNGSANEGSGLSLSAPIGKIFTSVIFASYGTPDGYSIGQCHAPNSVEKVAEVFLGKAIATIMAINDLFGDPCGGTYKSLAVSLAFGDAPVEPSPSPSIEPSPAPVEPSPTPTSPEPSPQPVPPSESSSGNPLPPAVEPTPPPAPSQEPAPTTPGPTPEPSSPPIPDIAPTPDETPIPEPLPEPEPNEPPPPLEPEPQPEPPVEPVEPPDIAPEPEPEPAEPPPPIKEPSPEPPSESPSEILGDILADGEVSAQEVESIVDAVNADGKLTEAEKAIVAEAIIAQFDGEPVPAAALAAAGIDYGDLPPETPVETRLSESGEPIVITAEVADALQLVENPAELVGAIFTDPAKALLALGSIGADMSDTERQESQTVVVASVIVGAIASLSIRRM